MNVSVFGLGYVGCVSAASFAADGHDVVGVDVNPDKVASDQRRAQPDRRARARRADSRDARRTGACARRPTPPRRCTRTRRVAALRRHAEPQERQPRPDVPRTRLRADRRRARATSRPITSSSCAAPCCRARRTTSSSRRSSGARARSTARASASRSTRSSCARARRSQDFRKPPLTLVGHNHAADASGTIALYQTIDAPLVTHQHPRRRDDEVHEQHLARAEGVLRQRDRQPVQARSTSTATR